jgi:DNA-binding transcriptional MerR regulator
MSIIPHSATDANGRAMPATRPKRETWRDYQEPSSPDPETFTRPQFVDRLRAEGIDVSPRTLAYWEAEGIIPHSTREWRDGAPHAIYPDWFVGVVKMIQGMQAEGVSLKQIREVVRMTPWLMPIRSSPPPKSPADLAARFDAYTRAAEALGPQLAELARLSELVYGTPVINVAVQFRDENGTTGTHNFGSWRAWLHDQTPDDSTAHTE